MKKLIKPAIILLIVIFALFNYRVITFGGGFSKFDMEDAGSSIEDSGSSFGNFILTLSSIEKVEYYEKTIKFTENTHNYYILTSDGAYLMESTEDGVDAFKLLGIFSEKLQPKKITPIPYYIDLLVIIAVIFIPLETKKKKGKKRKSRR